MAARADSGRDLIERLGLAAIGAVALTADRMDELASELAERGAIKRDDARQLLEDATSRWRADTSRVVVRTGETLHGLFVQLGLVSREEFDELELRLAQLEHRLRLVESGSEGDARPVQD
jgi:polyhydroxyalkanoate synthesis regulator phasin